MRCVTARSVAMILFALATETLTKRIEIKVNSYFSLITDVHKHYRTSSIIFVHGNYEDLKLTTKVNAMIRRYSRQQVITMTVTFEDLVSKYHEYQKIVRPLFVVLLDTRMNMDKYIWATKNIKPISFPVWFVMFLNLPGNPLEEDCRQPTDNMFNLDFGTIMLVLCYDHPILAEWYALRDNRIKTYELATWNPDDGKLNVTAHARSFYARRSNMFGDTLRVVSVYESPFFSLENGTPSGFLGSLLMELSKALNFTMQIQDQVKTYGNWNPNEKVWTGVMGELVADKADIGIGGFSMTTRRLDVIDFTLPLMYSRNRLYIKQPDGTDVQWLTYLKAFSRGIWTGIVIIIVCAPIILAIMKARKRFSIILLLEKFTHVWGIFCQQGLSEFPNESPMRLAFFSIFVSSLVVSAAYSASLISFLTLPTASLPFSTMEGFVEDGSYKLIVLRNSADYDMFNRNHIEMRLFGFQYATNPLLLKMNATMKDKMGLPLTEKEGFEQVCNENVAFYTTQVLRDIVRTPCNVVYVEAGTADSLAMVLRKRSPYANMINYHIRRFLGNGVLKRLRKKHLLRSDSLENTPFNPVGLWGIAPILTVMAVGTLLGIFILLLEKAYYVITIRYKNKSLVKNMNYNHAANLHIRLQRRRNLKFQQFYNMNYPRPIGYWP